MDNVDSCLGTPNGESVNSSGCSLSQLDTDNDGVSDDLDICPLTPSGESPDAQGCSPSQFDADGDNIMDLLDQCPSTPSNETADATGCSQNQVGGLEVCSAVNNVALSGTATQSSNYSSTIYLAINGINGTTGDFTHTAGVDESPSWSVDLSSDTAIKQVILHNRDNCCQDRLKDITVTVKTATGNIVYTSPLLNFDNWLSSPESMTLNLPTETVGSIVTVSRTTDGSGGRALSLGEVQVMGCTDYDVDNDEIFNVEDNCPDTPEAETADSNGCSLSQLDSDADGVSDDIDQCPLTPTGDSPNAVGCGLSQIDTDADSIVDANDLCPNTPLNEPVNPNGCSLGSVCFYWQPAFSDLNFCTAQDSPINITGIVGSIEVPQGYKLITYGDENFTGHTRVC